ncbi:MAG: hypothetical protein HYY16_14425, partial [Planctomycetes bacterium]|nr:hypothetical protein [Planctomycetota bacterium]
MRLRLTAAACLLAAAAHTAWAQPAPPTNLGQFRANGATPIAEGGLLVSECVVLQATLPVAGTLQIELKPTSVPFDGTDLKQSASVAAGIASIVLSANSPGAQYHWRARMLDDAGIPSTWADFGTNSDPAIDFEYLNLGPPSAPSIGRPQQVLPDGVTVLPPGTTTSETSVILRATVFTWTGTGSVSVLAEIQPVGTDFTGIATHQSPFVSSGSVATINVGLTTGAYHWRVQSTDSVTTSLGWISFGGNAEDVA